MGIGRQFVSEIKKAFQVTLPKNEAQDIAMHLINAQHGEKELGTASQIDQAYEEILEHTTNIVKAELHTQIRRNTFNYARYATHIQHLLPRAVEDRQIDSKNLWMYESLQRQFPQVAACADKIGDYYAKQWQLHLSHEEKLYLILYINQICSDEG